MLSQRRDITMRLPPLQQQQQGRQASGMDKQNAARDRQPRQQRQQWQQQPLPQEKVVRWPRNMSSASSQGSTSIFSKLSPAAAAVSCVYLLKTSKSALISVASLVWKICHVDGLLLLVAAAPAASTAFTGSLQGTAVLPGWQLLFSWQASLPLSLLGCCCLALYRARIYQSRKQQSSSSCLDPQLQQTSSNASVTCCCSSSASGKHLYSVAASPLQEEEQQQQQHVLQERRHQQKSGVFIGSRDSQLEQQVPKEKQLHDPLPSIEHDERLLQKQQQPLHHARTSLQYGEPPFLEEDAEVEDAAAWKRQSIAASSSQQQIALGGYREGERCLDDSGDISSDGSPTVITAEHPAKISFSRAESTTCALAAEDGGASGDSSSDVGGSSTVSKSPNAVQVCWRRRGRRKQVCTPAEAAAVHFFPEFLTAASNIFGGSRFQRLLSFAKLNRRLPLVQCKFKRIKKEEPSPPQCAASHSRKDSCDKQDVAEQADTEADKEAEEEEEEDQEANDEEESFCVPTLPTSCGSNSSSGVPFRNHLDMVTVQERRTSKFQASRIARGCPQGSDNPPAPCRRKGEATSAGGGSSRGSPVEVERQQQRRRQGQRGQGPRSSSAFVAVLLLPAFICCWFPSAHNADKQAQTSVEAARAQVSWEKASSTNPHSSASEPFDRNTDYFSFSRADAAAYAEPPLASDVLRVVLALLPTSLVAGSFVSLLLWHSPAAVVRLREVGWLITAYAAAWAATCCYSSHHIAIAAAALAPPHTLEVDLVGKDGSVTPSPLSSLGSDRTILSWTGSPLSSQWKVLCVYCVCTATIGLCIALQLLYFHCCFKKAPRCFSLVEGSLVAQLATALTYVSAAYTCCSYYVSHGDTPNAVSNRGSFTLRFLSTIASSIQNVSKGFAWPFSDASESLRSQVLSVSNALHVPTEAAWRSFASHVWLLLLLLISFTLLLTIFDDESPAEQTDSFNQRRYSASSRRGEGAINHPGDEQSEGNKVVKRDCRTRVKVLVFLFALALVAYLCCSPMMHLHPFSTFLAKQTSHTRSSNPFIASSNNTRSEREEDLTFTAITNDSSPKSGGRISACGLGMDSVLTDAAISRVAETPLTWVMHLIVNDPRHTWLFLLWFALSAAGIPLVAAVTARAASLKDVAISTPCMGARVVLTAAEAAYDSDSHCNRAAKGILPAAHCNRAAKGTLPAVGENCVNKKRSALLKTFARKLFHFLLIAVVATGYYIDAHIFTALSLCGLLWIFVFCEYIRVSRVSPKLSSQLTEFFSRFVDSRDKNGLFLTHMYLLLGVALPFVAAVAQGDSVDVRAHMVTARNATSNTTKTYATPCSHRVLSPPLRETPTTSKAVIARGSEDALGSPVAPATTPMRRCVTTGYEGAAYVTSTTEETRAAISVSSVMVLQSLLGLLLVGIGDSMSALVGMTWGARKIPFTKRKTCLGSAAFFASPAMLILFVVVTSRTTLAEQWISLRAGLVATGLATLFEACTPDIDNCILSLFGVVAYNGALPVL